MKKIRFFIILGLLIFSSISLSFAGETKKDTAILAEGIKKEMAYTEKEPITVNGDMVEYFQNTGEVVASKNVEILFKDMRLTCDKIRVNVNTREGLAEGNVKLYQDSNVFSGDMVSYNFQTQKGTILSGDVKAAPWYGKAEKIDKVSNNQYNLQRSYITTCDLENPHYRLQSKSLKIFPGDRVEANHIVAYLGKFPVMYLPYYKHSLKDNQIHVSVTPGKNKEWGYFVLTRWRYYFNDNAKGNIFLDYRQKKGIAEGIDYKYTAGKLGNGYLRFYYTKEDDKEKTVNRETERYLIQYRHRVQIDKDTLAIGELHKMSDANFLQDYFYRDQYEKDNQPPTYVSVIRTRPGYVATLYVQQRVNDFFTEVERLPELKLDIKDTRLGKTDFYYKGDIQIVNLAKKFANKTQPDMNVFRIDTFNKGSYVTKFFNFLNVIPYVATRQTYYSRNLFDEKNLIRGVFQGGVDSNFRLSRVYDVKTNFLGMDINRLRHIITPSVSYNYIGPPTIAPENLQQFDDIDAVTRSNTIGLSLENKLQTKRKIVGTGNPGVDAGRQAVDLARFIVSTDYSFKPKNGSGSQFGDFIGTLELRPYDWLFLKLDADYSHAIPQGDQKISAFKTVDFDMTATHGDLWAVSLEHRYERKASSILSALINYKFTPKWKIRALGAYDFKTQTFSYRELTVTRDLHCWEMDLTANIKNTSDITFYVQFRLKAFPGTPLELKTTYSRATPGSQKSLPQKWMDAVK